MKNLLYISILAASLLSSCSAKRTCNKILDAAKDGKLIITFPWANDKIIETDYYDYFTDDPSEYVSEGTYAENIFIPQFFDSYRLLSVSEIELDTLRSSYNFEYDLHDPAIYEMMKKYIFEKDSNAWIENEIAFYVDGLVKTQKLVYLIKKGETRFKQSFYCVKKDEKWLIYLAIFERV